MTFKLRKGIAGRTTIAFRQPPRSGNSINGLGEKKIRRAVHVFHSDGSEPLEWDKLDRAFAFINPWPVVYWIFRNVWNLRKASGPASPVRCQVEDTVAMTRKIKERARSLGADLVGITTVKPAYLYQGRELPYKNLISVGVRMRPEKMKGVPDRDSATEVMRAYARVGKVVSEVAEEIRSMGWPARAYGNPNSGDLLQIPAAIDAGLGELGKHGSLISRELGSNFRLGCVVTDLPLQIDAPRDIAVDDLCARCTLCVRSCPVDAIFNQKQWVRGVEKWYVDFDKCIYYFVETFGCGICIEVCPWSREGKGERISELLLAARKRRAEAREPMQNLSRT